MVQSRSILFGELPAPGAEPIEVEVRRGCLVESRHRVACAVVAADGATVAQWGDVAAPVYPRSALKPLQALALVETGAADAFGLGERELALASASHNGEPVHVAAVAGWLERIGLSISALECGPERPRRETDAEAMVLAGRRPTDADNNCSGKHAGMLTLARHLGQPTTGYTAVDHPVQQAILAIISALADVDLAAGPIAIDGCSAPNPALPLGALARAFAQFAAPDRLAPARAAACRRLQRAMAAEPHMIAGTGRLCTALIAAGSGRLLVKSGAEGVYAAALPGAGLGIALKTADGAGRAAQMALGAVLHHLGHVDRALARAFGATVATTLINRRGLQVGEIRIAER